MSLRRASARLSLERLEARDVPAMGVGMNLDWITDYAPAWVFKDAFQQSRAWLSQEFNTVTRQTNFLSTRAAHTDANGWPTTLDSWTNEQGQVVQQRLTAVMYLGTNGAHPAGVYHAQWRGTGALSFSGDARVISQADVGDGRHTAELQVTPSNAGIYLRIDSMADADPIRDVHVWLPDYNGQSFAGQAWHPGASFSPFHPLFLQRLGPFDTIRFMQPSDTNTSDVVHWSDSRPVSYARQSTFATDFQNGMSPEYVVELANELHANAWFNMPHAADDDYVRSFATLVRDTLDPHQKVYVEWSNEVWNYAPGFEGHSWARAQAEAEGIRIEDVVARETRRDFAIWSQVFAGQQDRLVRVVGGFTPAVGQYGWNNQVLSRMNGEFDALAVAPYVSPPRTVRETYTSATTVDQVLADTQANVAPVADLVRQDAALVRQYEAQLGRDLKFLAYEGGMHLDLQGGEPYQAAFFAAAADPRTYGLVTDYLHAMQDAGLDSFDYYKFTDRRVPSLMNPDFGTLSRMDQPLDTAPRYRALTDFIANPGEPAAPPVVTIQATDASAAEAGRDPATFTVTRQGGRIDQPLTVTYAIGGTATNGSDYAALSGSVVIPAGQTSAVVTVTPIDDPTIEPAESVTLALVDGTDYDLGAATTASARLVSDDVLPTVGVSVLDNYAAEAGRNTATFVVRRSGPVAQALTVRYSVGGSATNGRDYEALGGSVTIPAGQATANVVVTPIDDAEVEPTETIVLTLLAAEGYQLGSTMTTASANLSSDDVAPPLPTVALSVPDAAAAEAGQDPARFVVSRGGSLLQPLTVTYAVSGTATNGSDYTALSGSVVIPAGQSYAVLTVTPVDDRTYDPNETVVVTLQAGASYRLGTATATATIADNEQAPLPVLMVIANQDFYYQEYGDTRQELERAGLTVVVAAATRTLARPHVSSGQGADGGFVMPDLALADARAANYSAVVFVGGWGASAYQYGFSGTYANAAYNGSAATELTVNNLINDFVAQDKYVTAICHGVSVLAWARVNGTSLLAGRTVVAYAGTAPPSNVSAATTTRWHVESNGATMLPSRSVGDRTTAIDDVFIDGHIITAENFDSARRFGQVIAQRLRG